MMPKRPSDSIFRRLLVGLGSVAAVTSLLLLVAVFIDYHLTFQDLAAGGATQLALHEVMEHVALPALLFPVPAALAVIVVLRRALAPLDEAVADMKAIAAGQRGYRLSAERLPAEIRPFAESINALLARLEDAAALQEAFAADVAHELRTPLAVMKLEVERLGTSSVPAPSLAALSDDIGALQRLVDQLLLLAHVKAEDSVGIPRQPVVLADVAREVVAMLAPVAIRQDRNLAFEDRSNGASVSGWTEAIAAAVRNLVENAIIATPRGTVVRISVGPGARIAVADHGPGLTGERLQQLAKRHVRADRTRLNGAGIGLEIVSRIMASHGGKLETDRGAKAVVLNFDAASGDEPVASPESPR